MYLLDTDHIGIIQRQTQPEFGKLAARLALHPMTDFFCPIIAFHEQIQGWTAYISRAHDTAGAIHGYAQLLQMLTDFNASQVLPFDQDAGDQFDQLRQQRIRIGTMDLRIVAIALARRFTLLTRNLRDFRQVPGLSVEDWTV